MRNRLKQSSAMSFLSFLFGYKIKQSNLNKTIGWEPDNETIAKTLILFVQWQVKSTTDSNTIISDGEKLEQIIDQKLKSTNTGKFFTSELIGKNYTILFYVPDYDRGLQVIKEVIQAEKAEQDILVAKRVYKSSMEWTYEILYAKGNSQQFYEMI